jgi:2,3-dihydroxybiphenyl 1,2-dioxygenase
MTDRVLNYESTVAVSQLGYLGLGVSSIDDWKEFACSMLGLQDNGVSGSGHVYLRMDDNHYRIVLLPDGSDDIAFQGWEVKDSASLDQMAAKINAHGLDVLEGSAEEAAERMVRRLIKFKDPAGIATEIYYGPLIDHKPFVSPRGLKGFKTDGLGMGHIVLSVDEPATYVRFLTDVLGAKISDYIDLNVGATTVNLTFLHVNPRHHSIAVVPRMKPKADGPPPRKLNHLMVELNDLDDVGMAFSTLQQKGVPIGNLGRHTNDRMLSFYVETPSGFNLEYGFGGLLIEDEATWHVQSHRATSIWGHGMPQRPPAAPPQAQPSAD